MIEIAIQPAKEIIEALSWTERYGGVARTIEIPQEAADNRVINKTYPVRKDLSADQCFRQNRYMELVPDSLYKSLVYFEQLGDFKQQKGGPARSVIFAGRVRLVYWLNYQKQGVEDDGSHLVSGHVAAQLVKSLETNKVITAPFSGNVQYDNFSIVESTPAIFSKYSYDQNVQALLFYPYDYGAIDFDVLFMYGKDCLNDLPFGAEIDCIQWS